MNDQISLMNMKFEKRITDLKNEMNFSSIVVMLDGKADRKDVNSNISTIKERLLKSETSTKSNKGKVKKLEGWVEEMSEILVDIEAFSIQGNRSSNLLSKQQPAVM